MSDLNWSKIVTEALQKLSSLQTLKTHEKLIPISSSSTWVSTPLNQTNAQSINQQQQ